VFNPLNQDQDQARNVLDRRAHSKQTLHVAVIHHLGRDKPAIVGHDWGAAAAWVLAAAYPEVVDRHLQFRGEFFFNHPQFDLPNATIGLPSAGIISSTVGTPRDIQFSLRLRF
jgi:hypothetical protein